ncbi:MAG: TlpA family protein disulfide reductase [gamma proteobacterium symbiont of Bathyaustriella thionipta]|nr:TlpA family protein disulfide reductase [gamma proteobacterium symbiont of Bathyaustriella thionipta]MCU7950927.1 TlpA family protein disulfide reductase [gamma proteobacterium symbiont of Bathyaustriella thionipta]MCU7952666.1 TlpA family protein disulfide reductase [gamma proteobacterium symbiont of Bathyaustriella thionipta]MCU7957415.1 TlpA family protein disulfide reductase [gamma proteobacterium symbiont of Bathyaustriella thionipta]MCU7967110.1 TlpA family protein disulfide reductase 
MNNKITRYTILFSALFCLSASASAVDFSFTDMENESHQLSQYKGKWVLVNFWATWCPPCRKEIPDLSDFHLEHDDAVVLGVNYEPGLKDERLKKFIALYLVAYPVTRVNGEIINALGEPRGLPTSILIDPQGNIAKRISGMVDERRLNTIIEQHQSKLAQEK